MTSSPYGTAPGTIGSDQHHVRTDPPPYDKRTDPFRVSEQHVRDEIAFRLAHHAPFDLVVQGDFTEGGDGYYATVQCVLKRPDSDSPFGPDRAYVLSEVILQSEADGIRGVSIQRSTYDLTETEARDLL